MAKDYKKPEIEQDTRKCYKCKRIGYIAKNYQSGQKIKNRSIQKETNTKDRNKGQSFENSPK